MTVWKPLSRAAGLGLCVVAFTGSALADPGNGNGNGPAATPPGQEKKAEAAPTAPAPAPAQPQNAGQEKKAETPAAKPVAKPAGKPAAKAAKPAAKPAKKAKPQPAAKAAKPATAGGYKSTSQGTDLKKGMAHKHTICHATGSDSNPYVRITPSVSGVHNGHVGHQDGEDIVPPYTYKGVTYSQNWDAEGQAIFAAGCAVPASTTSTQASSQSTQDEAKGCPAATTERVLLGVWHATGAVENGERKYVFITPAAGSAHYDRSKHPDDRPVYETRTTTATGENCEQAVVRTSTTPPPASGLELPRTAAAPGSPAATFASTASAPAAAEAGGVLGAVSPARASSEAKPEDRGGVLGAIASAPAALAETATATTLPFTGMPLWVATLFGLVLLAGGIALRRSV